MNVTGRYGEYVFEDTPFNRDGRFGRLFRSVEPKGLVYKGYREPINDELARKQLLRVRQLGREVLVKRGRKPGDTPESSINWPIDTIEHGGLVEGVILPEIPRRFFRPKQKPRTLDFLIMSRAKPPEAWVRVRVLIRLAEILNWLQRHGLIHGDLSQKNVVWCLKPEPGAYLIDCDGLRTDADVGEGVATDGWVDPRLTDRLISNHDQYSDWFALGLAMYRGLLLNTGYFTRNTDGSWPVPARFPKDLDARVRDQIRRMLAHPYDVDARTSPSQWIETLKAAFIPNGDFNHASLRVLDEHARVKAPRRRRGSEQSWATHGTNTVPKKVAARTPRPPSPPVAPRPVKRKPVKRVSPPPTTQGSPPAPPQTSPAPSTSPTPSSALMKQEPWPIRLGRSAVPNATEFTRRLWICSALGSAALFLVGVLPFPHWLEGLLVLLSAPFAYLFLPAGLGSAVVGGWYGAAGLLIITGAMSIWFLFLVCLITLGVSWWRGEASR